MKLLLVLCALTALAASACVSPTAGQCSGEAEQHPTLIWKHIAYDTPATYNSVPPSSGAHFAWWASYGVHETPIDPREYVHNLEHGAIVLLYNCSLIDNCDAVIHALTNVMKEVGPDPLCTGDTPARIVVAPAPELDVPIAAASWGWTYRSTCLDPESLNAFAKEHYGKGREANCSDGSGL